MESPPVVEASRSAALCDDARRLTDMSLKRGQELYDADDGSRWLVYKKQCRHVKQPYADEAGCYNGYYLLVREIRSFIVQISFFLI
jgi:hypothetical protein